MSLLERVLSCSSSEEIDVIITEAVEEANKSATIVEQIGFLDYGKENNLFRGFIPFDTRIKYSSMDIETYGMDTTDFFYDFAHILKKYNISSKGSLIYNIEPFINNYFGYAGKQDRGQIFYDVAWNSTTTDEEFFEALKNNKLGDLKGKGAAECTERGALAQQLLSLFGVDTYYCMGCIDLGDRQEGHCFNIVKRNNDYALLDYSVPVPVFDKEGKRRGFYPFVGSLSNEEFEEFVAGGTLKSFREYKYVDGKAVLSDGERSYIVGAYEIKKEESSGMKK